jgi:hypothetical protein
MSPRHSYAISVKTPTVNSGPAVWPPWNPGRELRWSPPRSRRRYAGMAMANRTIWASCVARSRSLRREGTTLPRCCARMDAHRAIGSFGAGRSMVLHELVTSGSGLGCRAHRMGRTPCELMQRYRWLNGHHGYGTGAALVAELLQSADDGSVEVTLAADWNRVDLERGERDRKRRPGPASGERRCAGGMRRLQGESS